MTKPVRVVAAQRLIFYADGPGLNSASHFLVLDEGGPRDLAERLRALAAWLEDMAEHEVSIHVD